MLNHMQFDCCSHYSAILSTGCWNFKSQPALVCPPSQFHRKERKNNSNGVRRVCGLRSDSLRASGSCSVAVRCSSSQLGGLTWIAAEDVERTKQQIFEEGFAVFPHMWSKVEVAAAGGELVVGRAQEEVLKSFLMDPVGVCSQQQWLHAPGYRCTDASTSPEPYWHHSWQIAGLECKDLEFIQTPPWSATLVVSLSGLLADYQAKPVLSSAIYAEATQFIRQVGHRADRKAKIFCGGVAVFPRSHWIVQDRMANSTPEQSSFPHPSDVPAAAPTELKLECGDMALLHPLLAYTIAPNVSSTPAQFLIFNLGDATSNRVKPRIDEGDQMWSGWHSMVKFLMDQTPSVEAEMMQLTEEGKAQLGGWQYTMTGLTIVLSSPATSLSTRIAPRDLLAWRLRTSAVQFMQDGQWSNALSMLLRLTGLRPTCYWTALKAGQCCMKSAPAGQLGGRAGRKCTLEDGERFLLRAIEIAPGWPCAYAELMRCLALMGRGREQEVSGVMETMKRYCKLEQLCLRYPSVSTMLQESWNDCEALRDKFTSGARA